MESPKIIAFEGEFAMSEGHAQELKTQALALQVGKRLRVMFSDNNAGIDDALIGGVIDSKFDGYRLVDQWTSYGWNVLTIADGHDYDQIVGVLKAMEDWDPGDRRPMIVDRQDHQGLLAGGGRTARFPATVRSGRRLSEPSLRDEDELGLLRRAREDVRSSATASSSQGIRNGAVTDPRERLIQFKTNIDVVMSVLEQNGLGDWLADRLVEIGDSVKDEFHAAHRRQAAIRSSTSVCASPICPDEPQTVDGEEPGLGRGEGGQDRAVPQGRRSRGRAPRASRKSSSG